jgi:conjugative relaxase-like TrwC/TraI family protein
MMTVHKIGGEDATRYATYLAGQPTSRRRGDYYLGPQGSRSTGCGSWHGRGAQALNLDGDVAREDLLRAWEGRDPGTAEIAVKRAPSGEHVAAVDCTFSAPKSVSILWATASGQGLRDAIEAAQSEAVSVAINHIEGIAPLVRERVGGRAIRTQTAGVIASIFRHHTSRLSAADTSVNAVPDPQLHNHAAIANMALREGSSANGTARWGAVDRLELYRIAAEAGAVYRAELANGLQQLGYFTLRRGRYFEVVGVPEKVRDVFSTRSRDIKEARREFIRRHSRAPSRSEAQVITFRTRAAKSVEPRDPFPVWQQRARSLDFVAESIPRQAARHHFERDFNSVAAAVLAELTDPRGSHSLTSEPDVFGTRQLRVRVAEAAQGRMSGRPVAALIEAVSTSPELVQLDNWHWTTRQVLHTQRSLLDRAFTAASRPTLGEIDHATAPQEPEAELLAGDTSLTYEQWRGKREPEYVYER